MRSRRTIRPPDLTSLVDVMFILVFAALIRSAAIEPAESAPAPPPAPLPEPGPPAPPPTYTSVRDQAMATLRADLEARPAVVARVSADGVLTALELADRTIARGLPLLERVADADVALAYLGDRSPELRICKVVARDLGVPRLDDQIVAITPDVPIAELPVALVAGLRTDVERCLVDTGAIGVLVDATPEDHDRPTP